GWNPPDERGQRLFHLPAHGRARQLEPAQTVLAVERLPALVPGIPRAEQVYFVAAPAQGPRPVVRDHRGAEDRRVVEVIDDEQPPHATPAISDPDSVVGAVVVRVRAGAVGPVI